MVKSFVPFATLLLATASAASVPDGTWPTSTGTVQYAEAYIIKAGEVFDGKMQTFERSDVSCEGQTESGADTAVFKMEPGATLKNAIIGKNQMEGVHCDKHDCTIENVWWDDVCEDALSIKGGTASSVSTVTGGGARSADDKVIQHNGYGTVKIDGFYGEDISKLYRSCGTCGDRPKKVSVSNVYVVNPGNAIVTVNKNWNDEATLSNIWVKSSNDKVKICQWSQGNADGEPSMLGDGPSPPLCQYSESDVHINGDVSQATGTSTSNSSSSTETQSSSTGSAATQTTISTASSQESAPSASTPTNSSTAASDSNVPGTVAPAGSNSNSEQTSVSTESSQTQQNETSDESNDETTQTQQSTTSSNKNGDSDDAQNEEQTITASGNGSTTSDAGTSTTESSTAGSTTQASSDDSTTQNSSAGSTTQSSGTGSTAQTSTNSSTSTSTGSVPDGTWPASTGTVQYTEPYTIKAGEVFDGKMQTFERSDITCSGGEGQKDTAVFLVEAGGTLKNAIIGKNQKEGVHCDDHDCTIENVWWDDVCEDALSIKGGTASSVTTVTNCGARYASDKVVQHNGYGTVKIDGFFAQEFGKLYRSCGTCGDIPRTVTVDNVYAIDPLVSVITVNKNYGDQAKLSNIHVKTTNGNNDVKVCQWSQGGSSPSNLGDGPSGTLCQYSESDVHINE
ncbi:Pectate lyase [Phytophthora nicotianae]|uniref:Probable pectate lyase F n=1 Tax=Phytophthora nicotianae TaxID=4792 RepID=A0A0W8CPQ0_PHYNI|nr:Pectate lyase [Phytophthora nicotianae]